MYRQNSRSLYGWEISFLWYPPTNDYVFKQGWTLSIKRKLTSKVFGHVGRKGIGNTLIRIQGRHSRFEIFSLFYEFSYFHLFCLFFCLKSYIWKRLTFRVISTFYGNINTCALGFHMALAHRRVPKVLVYLVITLLLMKVLVFTHKILKKKVNWRTHNTLWEKF